MVFGCKTATFGPEQQVSICPRHHLSFCACKTEWLAQELLVFMGPSPPLWILDAKQRLFAQNNKSVWVTALTCEFWLQNSVFLYRIISLYVSQTSPVALCMLNIVISTRYTSLWWSQTSPVVLCMQNSVPSIWNTTLWVPDFICGIWMQNSDFWTRLTSLYGSQTSPVVLCMQNSVISIRKTSLYGSQPSSVDFGCKTVTFGRE